MSSRERFLIVLLAAVVILLGGYKLLLEPGMKALTQTNADLQTVNSEYSQAQLDILRAQTIDSDNNALESKITETSQQFFPQLETDKIQYFFTQMATETGIQLSSLTMTAPVAAQISASSVSGTDITYPAKDAAEGINALENGEPLPTATPAPTQSTAGNSNTLPKDMIEMMSVTMQFETTYEQALDMITAIKNSGRTARISSINMVMNAETNLLTVNITVECFGVEKVTEDTLSENNMPAPDGKGNPFLS